MSILNQGRNEIRFNNSDGKCLLENWVEEVRIRFRHLINSLMVLCLIGHAFETVKFSSLIMTLIVVNV